MRYTEGKVGRIFVVRLEDRDKLPEAIESFAQENKVSRGMCILVGGIKNGGKIVVGPEDSELREGKTRSGCIRPGIEVWKLGEVIVLEITASTAHRKEDTEAGFSMLEP